MNIDAESSSHTSEDSERQQRLRPGDAGKKGVTSIFGNHSLPRGAASQHRGTGVQQPQ